MEPIKFGTCSWNYDSWVGLVYSEAQPRSAGYLEEYSKKYRTAEIDSWFYKLPESAEAREYLSCVDGDFTFSCKAFQGLTLTHKRRAGKSSVLEPNKDFLSVDLFHTYLERVSCMIPRLEAIEFEFEYLNKEKMSGVDRFLDMLSDFFSKAPRDIPIALEPRNGSYLGKEYFALLKEYGLYHVFSEKIYMPHIYSIYDEYGEWIEGKAILRLLGGDRKAIEKKTEGRWDRIVDPKEDKPNVYDMVRKMVVRGTGLVIYVNNHYEGSAPLTIEEMKKALS